MKGIEEHFVHSEKTCCYSTGGNNTVQIMCAMLWAGIEEVFCYCITYKNFFPYSCSIPAEDRRYASFAAVTLYNIIKPCRNGEPSLKKWPRIRR